MKRSPATEFQIGDIVRPRWNLATEEVIYVWKTERSWLVRTRRSLGFGATRHRSRYASELRLVRAAPEPASEPELAAASRMDHKKHRTYTAGSVKT